MIRRESREGIVNRLRVWKHCYIVVLICSATVALHAQTLRTLYSFGGQMGANPYTVTLVQGLDGKLYGTTRGGGANGDGTVFKITENGTLTKLHDFCDCPDGDGIAPSGLVAATNGYLYGTSENGLYSPGTIFRVNRSGKFTTIYTFCAQPNCTDGHDPRAGLLQGSDGQLYGTTHDGGAYGGGTVFRITLDGTLTTLHSFNGDDGSNPAAKLTQGWDANFYGTTNSGGINAMGTVFKITPAGRLTTLYTFCTEADCPDGGYPLGGMIQGSDLNFYGTTLVGGQFGGQYSGGTVYKITPRGALTLLYSFGQTATAPYAGLVQGTDGNLYGTTEGGGLNMAGTIFKTTTDGLLTIIYSFCNQLPNCPDGAAPVGGLMQATDGLLYGTTLGGGQFCCGTVFNLDVGLNPFVSLFRGLGKVGATEGILGQGLSTVSQVSFNGTSARFDVKANTLLFAQVPTGATTGFVTLTTQDGTLTSNKPFRVTPQLLTFDPPSGPVGTQVIITGISLTQTQGVAFGDHIPAQFTVNSDTQVTATVPQGARTGKIGIETVGGFSTSEGDFAVTH